MIVPIKTWILAVRDKTEEVSKGGILLPDQAKRQACMAVVHAVGNDVTEVAVGEKVLFGKYNGEDIIDLGYEYILLKEDEILAIIGEADEN